MCDTSGPNTGSILSLNAIGKQDTYLLKMILFIHSLSMNIKTR